MVELWHREKVSKEEVFEAFQNLPITKEPTKENSLELFNEKEEKLVIYRIGADTFFIEADKQGIYRQAIGDMKKAKEVLNGFVDLEKWESLCEWLVEEERQMTSERKVLKEIKEKTIEELTKEMLDFIGKEFPEVTPSFADLSRIFWSKLGIGENAYFLGLRDPDFALKKEKVEMLVKKKLEEIELKRNKKLLTSLKPLVLEWAKKNDLKKVTQTDIDLFLIEKEVALSRDLKRMLYRLVSLEQK